MNMKVELYVHSSASDGHLHPGAMVHLAVEKELSVFKQGKGSIQFPLDKPIPKALVMRMIKYRKNLILKE